MPKVLAALVAEVHVDIGHAHPLGIEEALKGEVVLNGVQLGDVQAVGHDAGRAAAAPGADHDAAVLGELHKVPDDEEVIHIPHLGNDPQLVLQPLPGYGVGGGIALGEALLHQLAQQGIAGFPLGHGKVRQVHGVEVKVHPAAHGDVVGALHRVLVAGEEAQHLLLTLDVELVGLHAHTVGIIQGFARLDAHEHILGFGVLAGEVVAVVGGHQGDARALAHVDDAGDDALFIGNAVILDFQEEIALAEEGFHFAGVLLRLGDAAVQQKLVEIARKAGRQADQALVVLGEQLIIDAGAVIKAPGEGLAVQVHQVFVARLVFAQEDQVAVFALGIDLFVHVGAHVHFAADHGMDALCLAGLVKIDRAVQHAVVRDGAGVHAQRLQALGQLADAAGAVQQAVFAVQVQVRKCHGHTSPVLIIPIIPYVRQLCTPKMRYPPGAEPAGADGERRGRGAARRRRFAAGWRPRPGK